jgi:hypothetical protein
LISKKLAGFFKRLGKLVEFTIEKKNPKIFPFCGSKIPEICQKPNTMICQVFLTGCQTYIG